MAATPKRFEPQQIAAGDTISFLKSVSDYLPADGWVLHYELDGPADDIEIVSTASGSEHLVTVAAAVTAEWLPGEYLMAGYAVNDDTDERFQVYLGALVVTANLATTEGTGPPTTHAARMVPLIEAQLEKLAEHALADTKIEGTEIFRAKREELLKQRNYYLTELRNEQAQQRAANGLDPGNKIRPIFRVTPGFPALGAGNPLLNG